MTPYDAIYVCMISAIGVSFLMVYDLEIHGMKQLCPWLRRTVPSDVSTVHVPFWTKRWTNDVPIVIRVGFMMECVSVV